MMIMDVPEGEYLVFEHGPFDFETENVAVEQKIEQAMKDFDYAATGYELDTAISITIANDSGNMFDPCTK